MWIAACCLAYEVPLATLNLKDHEDFTEYHGLPSSERNSHTTWNLQATT